MAPIRILGVSRVKINIGILDTWDNTYQPIYSSVGYGPAQSTDRYLKAIATRSGHSLPWTPQQHTWAQGAQLHHLPVTQLQQW